MLGAVADETGLVVTGADEPPDVSGFRLGHSDPRRPVARANNMPGGWMRWLFEQYELGHAEVSSLDFAGDLSTRYDVIVLPSGTTRSRIVSGLDPAAARRDVALGVRGRRRGLAKLADWVRDGGTLVALGSAVSTARASCWICRLSQSCPRAGLRPPAPAARVSAAGNGQDEATEGAPRRVSEPGAAAGRTLRDRVVEPTSVFYCPGSLLKQEFNPTRIRSRSACRHDWPVFFRFDQAYRLLPSFETLAEVVSRYPDDDDMVASGWLLGDELLREQANVVSFDVGRGTAVTMGSQVAFRTQTRATFKLLFNAIFHGPAEPVTATELATLR